VPWIAIIRRFGRCLAALGFHCEDLWRGGRFCWTKEYWSTSRVHL